MPMWNFLFRLPNVKILDEKRTFLVKNKQKGKYVEKQSLISTWIKLHVTPFYMIREQEIYVLGCSKKQKLNITLITLFLKLLT